MALGLDEPSPRWFAVVLLAVALGAVYVTDVIRDRADHHEHDS